MGPDKNKFYESSKVNKLSRNRSKRLSELIPDQDKSPFRDEPKTQSDILAASINSSSEIVIFTLDKSYRYLAFNELHRQEMRSVWKVDIQPGMNLLDLMTDPILRQQAKESIDRSLAGEVVKEIRYQPDKDIYYEFVWNPVRQNNGKVIAVTAFIQNITERQKAEKALRKSEHSCRSLFKNMIDGYAYCQGIFENGRMSDFVYLEVNEAFNNLTGLREVIGKKITEVIPGIKESNPELLEIFGRVAISGQPERFETYVNSLGIWFSISIFSSEKGTFAAIFENITRRKQTEEKLAKASVGLEKQVEERTVELALGEEKYRLLIENANAAVVVFQDNHQKFFNSKTQEMSGYSKEELETKMISELVHPDDREMVVSRHLARQRGEMIPSSYEFRIIHKNGTTVWVSLNAVLILWEGKPAILGLMNDVTKRKQVEKDLLAKDAELELIINHTPFLLTRCSRDLHYRYVSRAYAKMVGRTPDQVAGKPIIEIMGRKGFETIRPYVEKVLQGQTVEYEDEVDFVGVGPRQLHVFYGPERDGQGQVIGWVASIIDISDRKKAEEALKESEERFLKAFCSNPVAQTIAHLPEGRWKYVNDSFLKLTEYSREEVIGHTSAELNLFANPNERAQVLKSFLEKGEVLNQEMTVRTKSGKLLTVLSANVKLNLNGQEYALSSNLDITRRKQAEEELQEKLNMLEQTQVMVRDLQGKISFWNQGAERLYGYSKKEAVSRISHNLLQTIFPEPLAKIEEELLQNGKWEGELIHTKKNGSKVLVSSIWTLYKGSDNQPLMVIETNNDITARKEAEQSLLRARNDLAQANKQLKQYSNKITRVQEEERKRIAYELHDDTAQYLSILKMQIGALTDSGEIQNPKIKERLQLLEKDADRAFHDVRRYSHELRPVVLEHQGLVAALEQMSDDFNKLGQLSVVVHIKGMELELSEEVKLGFFRIAQEALNNSRKHSKASQIDIDIGFNHKQIRMIISDNGEGFDTKEAYKKSGGKGSLGLMSMQERADLINADLKIESEPGKGTKVILKAKI